MRHIAIREDAGYIEHWPIAPYIKSDEDEKAHYLRPVDGVAEEHPQEKLARTIALEIKQWLDDGRDIFDRKQGQMRNIRAGDVMILVQKRGPLYRALLRHLKLNHVPVIGPDRLKLKETLVVKDLLTLAKFAVQPLDDLSLAELLKGPFFGFDETQLFDLAHNRKTSLWQALKNSEHVEEAAIISRALSRARRYAPYEFFSGFLDEIDQHGVSHWKKLYRRLSHEAQDAAQSFLAGALAHQRQGVPSLHDFVQNFRHDDTDIKRELDGVTDQVRVMTVHGAKGLEAPIVILPDSYVGPKSLNATAPIQPFIEEGEWQGYICLSGQTKSHTLYDETYGLQSESEGREYLRRLYVALTRAETELIICGAQPGNEGRDRVPNAWHDIVKTAMEGLGARRVETPFDSDEDKEIGGGGLAYGTRHTGSNIAVDTEKPAIKVPEFLTRAAPEPVIPYRHVTPSHMVGGFNMGEATVRSPLTETKDRFARGNIIHKLLEILPEVEKDRREIVTKEFLDHYGDLDAAARSDISSTCFSVLNDPEFSEFFEQSERVESYAEMSVSGNAPELPDDMWVNGQIDRLVVYPDRVLILDYKSNRPPPESQSGVAPIYMMQMATYRALIAQIYPKRTIECGLLWTDGPRLMKLSADGLDEALTMIGSVPT